MPSAEVAIQGARIALVDDDVLFRESVEQNLIDAGFRVCVFGDGPSMLDFFEGGEFVDLILLDWKMPTMNGIEVLRRLRETHPSIPVIFLTVLGDQIYEEAALQGGAVDFVEKSRSFGILRKRMDLILSGMRTSPANGAKPDRESPLTVGNLGLDIESGRASWKGVPLALSLTEFRMVHLLAQRAGRDVRYRDIYDVVHGEDFVAGDGEEGYRANVRTFIKRIRQKFRDVDAEFDGIQNYPGFGYRWIGDGVSEG
jgi:two-component system response regulator ChvI